MIWRLGTSQPPVAVEYLLHVLVIFLRGARRLMTVIVGEQGISSQNTGVTNFDVDIHRVGVLV